MSPRDRVAAILVTITLAVAAFAIGSAPRWAACLTAGLCLTTAIPLVRSRRYMSKPPLVLYLLLLMIGVTVIQLIPLPSGVVGFIAPKRWELVQEHAKAWATDPPGWMTLSYDYPGTLVELAKLVGYLAFAYSCLWLAGSSRGRRWLLSSIACVGGAMALTAIFHHLVSAKKLYGLYQPNFPAPSYMAPLLNPNQFAGLLAFASAVTIGLAVSSMGTRRVTWIGIGLLCAGVAFLTKSRAGVISLGAGAAVAGWLMWRQKRAVNVEDSDEVGLPRSVLVPAIVIMSCVLALLVAFTAGGVAQELSRTTTQQLTGEDYKLEVWRSSQTLMLDNPWTGVGRGAFEYTFSRVYPSGEKTFSHVENEYLQTILDWGFPAAAAIGLLFGLIALAAMRRNMAGPLEAGVLGGLLALAMHNFADFNLEFPAVALPALAGLAVLLPGKPRETRSRGPLRMRRVAVIGVGAVAVILASLPIGALAKDEAVGLDADLDAANENTLADPLVERAQALTRRHPSDYVAFGLAARALLHKGDTRAVKLVNRALYLNFEHSGVHWLAAQMLASTSRGKKQALVEYALALKTSRDARVVLMDLLARYPDAETAARGLPDDTEIAERLCDHLQILMRSDVALLYAKRLHKQLPDNSEMAGLVADYALLRGEVDTALVAAKVAFDRDKGWRNSSRLGKAFSAAGRNADAEVVLQEAILRTRASGTREDLVTLLTLHGDVQRLQGHLVQARETLLSAADLAPDRKRLAAIHRSLAMVEDASGNPTVAATERERAERLDPLDVPMTSGTISILPPDLTGFATDLATRFKELTGYDVMAPPAPPPGTTPPGMPPPGTTPPGTVVPGATAPGTTPPTTAPGTTPPTTAPGTTPPTPAPGTTTPGTTAPATTAPATTPPATTPPATQPPGSASSGSTTPAGSATPKPP